MNRSVNLLAEFLFLPGLLDVAPKPFTSLACNNVRKCKLAKQSLAT